MWSYKETMLETYFYFIARVGFKQFNYVTHVYTLTHKSILHLSLGTAWSKMKYEWLKKLMEG